MKLCTAVLMLHEESSENSATRRFRSRAVLDWTVTRAAAANGIGPLRVVCFDDQVPAVRDAVLDDEVIHAIGPRRGTSTLEAIAAARRWADGWRGGLLNSTEFDLGFDANALLALATSSGVDAIVTINASSALIDPRLVSTLIEHACGRDDVEMCFLPAAPGFGAMLLRVPLLARLASANLTPGRLLCYQPEVPMRDPLGSGGCVDVPLSVARSVERFKLDSESQIARFSDRLESLNGELLTSSAERVIAAAGRGDAGELPRDLIIELTTRRSTRPIFSAAHLPELARADMSLDVAKRIFEEAAVRDDVRVTLAGAGDPLLHEGLEQILNSARSAGIRAIAVETDLLCPDPGTIDLLAASGIDVVSVQLPAVSAACYAQVMGIDALPQVLESIRRLISGRGTSGRSVPILAPTFVKARMNLAEMEPWYDQWLRAVGTAVIVGPTTLGGMVEDVSVGDMSPPARVPCRRLSSRMTILSDGTVVRCEEDVLGRSAMGRIGEQTLSEIWRGPLDRLRVLHGQAQWSDIGPCGDCREWHRP